MKTPHVIGLVVVAVLVTVASQETRIARLKSRLAAEPGISRSAVPAEISAPSAAEADSGEARVKTKRQRPPTPAAEEENDGGDDESMARTVRKMWENPAGKAMMNQGVKFAVAMLYDDFIKTLGLTAEEEDYFKELLGAEIAAQQELGMKMMGASPEDRAKLAEELKANGKEHEDAIRKFLNSDEDYEAFTAYKERAPERQEIQGLRAALEAKGISVPPETETELVEAMYRARTESGASDLTGPDAFSQLGKKDFEATFEENWAKQDALLLKEVAGFLDPAGVEAVREFRGQMKEVQLMGLKMARKMMGGEDQSE